MNEVTRIPEASVKLLYPYGDGKGGYAIWIDTLEDAQLALGAAQLPSSPPCLRVVCDTPTLGAHFAAPKFEVLSPSEFAARKIPILVLPTAGRSEMETEQTLRRLTQTTGHNFSPYDAYNVSKVADEFSLRRYRDVELAVLPSVLWPTIYSNWEYINFLVQDLQSNTNASVLDMFAGSGVIGYCLKKELGIRSVSFCDVNYWAIRSIRATGLGNPALRPDGVFLSEGLTGVAAGLKFDVIVGNPPHANLPLQGPIWLAGSDPEWEAHHLFFRDADRFLREDGRILFIESASADIEENFYSKLEQTYPRYRLGRRIEMTNNICYIREVLLRSSKR